MDLTATLGFCFVLEQWEALHLLLLLLLLLLFFFFFGVQSDSISFELFLVFQYVGARLDFSSFQFEIPRVGGTRDWQIRG